MRQRTTVPPPSLVIPTAAGSVGGASLGSLGSLGSTRSAAAFGSLGAGAEDSGASSPSKHKKPRGVGETPLTPALIGFGLVGLVLVPVSFLLASLSGFMLLHQEQRHFSPMFDPDSMCVFFCFPCALLRFFPPPPPKPLLSPPNAIASDPHTLTHPLSLLHPFTQHKI